MNTFFSVLKEERRFIMFYGLASIIYFITSADSVTYALINFLQSFIIVTTAHEQYDSISERLMCILLASFLVFVTFFVGVELEFILIEILFSILLGMMFLCTKRITAKKS